MELWKKQKKIAAAFGIFLCFMLLCTLISRSVYASGLPQVTTDKPRQMELEHKVQAEGTVRQGMEYAVNTLSGLRCRTVHVRIGDRVTEETLLFEIDMEDLQEQIAEQELAIQKLKLTIQDQEQNKSLNESQRNAEKERAREDYERMDENTGASIDQAEHARNQAQQALDELKQNPVSITSKEERQAALDAYNAWVEKEAELKAALEKAGAGEDTEAYEKAKAELEDHQQNRIEQPDYSAEDAAQADWEARVKALEAEKQTADQALENAKNGREDAMLEAGRKLSDAGTPAAADSSLEMNRLDLKALQKKLEQYQAIQKADGKIYPEMSGIVTGIRVSPGERTPDGAAVVCADLESPLEFHVTLTGSQKKYVNQGDKAKLLLGKDTLEAAVDYVAESESSPELYEAAIFLPEGAGNIGESGIFEVSSKTESFSSCIPIDALHEDENKRKYVYILSERSGILGTELSAEKVYVKVLDQNESYAAIEEGSADSDTELIVSSTKDLNDRDIVRYKE